MIRDSLHFNVDLNRQHLYEPKRVVGVAPGQTEAAYVDSVWRERDAAANIRNVDRGRRFHQKWRWHHEAG